MKEIADNIPAWIEEEDFPTQYLYTKFMEVFMKYTHGLNVVNDLFEDVYKKYSGRGRHYHNVLHIYRMVRCWSRLKDKLKNRDAVFMAIIYHDIIYKPKRRDNEEASGDYFLEIAKKLNIQRDDADLTVLFIYVTKHDGAQKNLIELNTDLQYLLDFDLEVLGDSNWDTYDWYRRGVRKEYRMYPNLLYKPGRKKVLESFLNKEKIYFTKDFENRENIARNNLQKEINSYLC